ncbi:LysR family transcriptional regulator [Kribbella sp. NPDC056861]|uniref:LysR family transcriptional regulator n=1 Tax=Kribbella sp. NPDC056861 TaxID=3154857 RepID=UPI00342ECB66
MELREVEVFLVLAEELHFGRTAERLHLSQGRVSQLIRSLEREVGAALFTRTSRSVALTPLGADFRAAAGAGYDALTAALRTARAAARGVAADLHLSYMPAIGADLVTRVVAGFEQDQPQCGLVVSAMVSLPLEAQGMVLPGPADVGLVWAPEANRELAGRRYGPVLRRVPRGVVVPVDHPLAGREQVHLDDLADYVLLNPSDAWAPEYRDFWVPPRTPDGRVIRRTERDVLSLSGRSELTIQDILALVARGHGIHCTVASALAAHPFPGLTMVPLVGLPPMLVVPVWAAGAENATIRAFVESAARAAD